MSNIVKYKGYFSYVDFSIEDCVLHGKIEGIHDLVTFECENAKDAEKEFREAVDDYLAFCKEMGKEPEKAFKGSFNVRIGSELHKKVAIMAKRENVSQNQIIVQAVEEYTGHDNKNEEHRLKKIG